MNERYLFRGRRVDNGEWVEGDLSLRNTVGAPLIYNDCDHDDAVDTATIGQCTGLRDKNGTLVWEGDIFQGKVVDSFEGDVNEGHVIRGQVSYYQAACSFAFASYMPFDLSGLEVIGNVHDNPELMKGGNGDVGR